MPLQIWETLTINLTNNSGAWLTLNALESVSKAWTAFAGGVADGVTSVPPAPPGQTVTVTIVGNCQMPGGQDYSATLKYNIDLDNLLTITYEMPTTGTPTCLPGVTPGIYSATCSDCNTTSKSSTEGDTNITWWYYTFNVTLNAPES
jgi:hypothetical protein